MNEKKTAAQSQKLMVFVLTMSLYGLATLFTELIPKFQVGIVEFSVEYFLFIPLVLAILFDPMSAALGAATTWETSSFLNVMQLPMISGTWALAP